MSELLEQDTPGCKQTTLRTTATIPHTFTGCLSEPPTIAARLFILILLSAKLALLGGLRALDGRLCATTNNERTQRGMVCHRYPRNNDARKVVILTDGVPRKTSVTLDSYNRREVPQAQVNSRSPRNQLILVQSTIARFGYSTYNHRVSSASTPRTPPPPSLPKPYSMRKYTKRVLRPPFECFPFAVLGVSVLLYQQPNLDKPLLRLAPHADTGRSNTERGRQ